MKQKKTLKLKGTNEKINIDNYNIENNIKRKKLKSKNEKSNVINICGKITTQFSLNYDTKSYKNIKLKEKMMKILNQKGKKSKIKNKNGKLLILDNIENKENNSINTNLNINRNKKSFLHENYSTNNRYSSLIQYHEVDDEKKNKKYMNFRNNSFNDNYLEKNKTVDHNYYINGSDYSLLNNYNIIDNISTKNKKGIISFDNFFKNKNKDIEKDNDNDKSFFDDNNKFKKQKLNHKSFNNKKSLCLDDESSKIPKNKYKKLSYNFRNDNKNKTLNDNRNSTTIDKDTSFLPFNKGALKILEILQKNQSDKIILKQENNEDKNNNENNEIINNDKIERNNNNEININTNDEKADKKKNKTRNIFNEIIDEVKEEKNYVEKVVHRKIIEEMKHHLNHYNSYSYLDTKPNSKTQQNISDNEQKNTIKMIPKQNNHLKGIPLPILNNKNKSKENTNDIRSSFISQRSEKNINYIKKNNSLKNYDENHCVKIKRIKLDKLKNKLKRNSSVFCQTDNNINNRDNNDLNNRINISLNKKMLKPNNSIKIYAPKKPSFSKKKNIQLSSISFCGSNFNKMNNETNIINSIFDNKAKEENNFDKMKSILYNSIKSFNNYSITDLNKIKNNNDSIKTDSNIMIKNSKENNKYILYNKAHINKDGANINNKNIRNSRFKTIRYIKKNKNKIERIEDSLEKSKDKDKNKSKNEIQKIQEIQFGIGKKNHRSSFNYSKKTLINLDKTEPINFNLNNPLKYLNKQNSFMINKTFLSHDMDDITIDNPKIDITKKSILNLSQYLSNNDDDYDDNFINKNLSIHTSKYNTGTCKLGYNFNYENDKSINNIDDISNDNINLNYLKYEIKNESNIYNLLNFEDLLIIEDKLNLILIVLEKGNKTSVEHLDIINYFFASNIKTKLEQIFQFFKKESEMLKKFVNYTLIYFFICYDFTQNSINISIDNDFNLMEIAQIIYTNILILINHIKNKIEFENKDNYNIRLIELSKIGQIINNKLAHLDNDNSMIKEILHNNIDMIVNKITKIINNLKALDNKYNDDIFKDINNNTFSDMNKFFLDKILKEEFIGCSVSAFSYLKQKTNFVPARAPYIRGNNKKNYSLVLDLDETLIHFKLNNNQGEEGILKLRPGVFTFLDNISEFYEIILFTEASEAYIKLMLEAFNNNKKKKKYFDYIFYRRYTIIEGNDFIKDLSRLGRPLDRVIIIDNVLKNFCKQKKNGILIKPFFGEDQNDTALIDLIPILINIAKDEIDVRNGLTKYRDEILTKISSNLFRRNKKIK